MGSAQEEPDRELVLAAAGGDRAAFGKLLDRHYDRSHGLAWQLVGLSDSFPARARKMRGWLRRQVAKREDTRARRIAAFVDSCARPPARRLIPMQSRNILNPIEGYPASAR
ncbi:YdeI/OmpD-associated family protein [Haliangium ochraceum]|uniref:YdeI/OmpD-associated family protein n=1 Tax=Haliangium ochraceum TaxID=80816 RepID=UPI00019B9872|nr:YdeI/OmpD-associated family protein [Haliangium ochraceum]